MPEAASCLGRELTTFLFLVSHSKFSIIDSFRFSNLASFFGSGLVGRVSTESLNSHRQSTATDYPHSFALALYIQPKMRTRQKHVNYRVLNDGSDEEASPEDRIDQSSEPLSNLAPTLPESQEDVGTISNVPDGELLPSESASQFLASQESSTDAGTSIISGNPSCRHRQRPAPATEWIWAYFETAAVDRSWCIKKTKRGDWSIERFAVCILMRKREYAVAGKHRIPRGKIQPAT
jgi:hypothetical protein